MSFVTSAITTGRCNTKLKLQIAMRLSLFFASEVEHARENATMAPSQMRAIAMAHKANASVLLLLLLLLLRRDEVEKKAEETPRGGGPVAAARLVLLLLFLQRRWKI